MAQQAQPSCRRPGPPDHLTATVASGTDRRIALQQTQHSKYAMSSRVGAGATQSRWSDARAESQQDDVLQVLQPSTAQPSQASKFSTESASRVAAASGHSKEMAPEQIASTLDSLVQHAEQINVMRTERQPKQKQEPVQQELHGGLVKDSEGQAKVGELTAALCEAHRHSQHLEGQLRCYASFHS